MLPAMARAADTHKKRVYRELGKKTPTRTVVALWHRQRRQNSRKPSLSPGSPRSDQDVRERGGRRLLSSGSPGEALTARRGATPGPRGRQAFGDDHQERAPASSRDPSDPEALIRIEGGRGTNHGTCRSPAARARQKAGRFASSSRMMAWAGPSTSLGAAPGARCVSKKICCGRSRGCPGWLHIHTVTSSSAGRLATSLSASAKAGTPWIFPTCPIGFLPAIASEPAGRLNEISPFPRLPRPTS